ncbi:hypothetical protein F4804DRAFT_320095 [Jackrogersella minutella]|nr:hypothetical protein F4804DRAFT_320095 [Jackrogersella minutella]
MPPYTPAQVICGTQGSRQGECNTVHIELPPNRKDLPKPLRDWPDIRGLNSLQYSREEWLNADAIERALKAYREGLPQEAQDIIHIVDLSIEGMFHKSENVFEDILRRPYRRFFESFGRTEYTLWPINVDNNHWELAIIRKGRRAGNGKDSGFNRVLQVALVDSWRDTSASQRKKMIERRMRRFFESRNFTFASNCQREMWVPWQRDDWSCGLRTYRTARQVMDRIVRTLEDKVTYHERLWAPVSGWFNPDYVRWEMIGLNAYEAVKSMDYNARFAIEIVRDVRDQEGIQSAGDRMRPPTELPSLEIPARPKKRDRDDEDKDEDEDEDDVELPPPTRRRVEALPIPHQRKIASSPVSGRGQKSNTGNSSRGRETVWSNNEQQNPQQTKFGQPSGRNRKQSLPSHGPASSPGDKRREKGGS